jgi:hypothetical protein
MMRALGIPTLRKVREGWATQGGACAGEIKSVGHSPTLDHVSHGHEIQLIELNQAVGRIDATVIIDRTLDWSVRHF